MDLQELKNKILDLETGRYVGGKLLEIKKVYISCSKELPGT